MNSLSFYRCLASPTRLKVLLQLRASEEASVGDLVASTGCEQTNLSHQLRDLKARGLVTSRQEGKRVFYRLAHPRLAELIDLGEELAEHAACTDAAVCQEAGCC